jgi:hypothetical protein
MVARVDLTSSGADGDSTRVCCPNRAHKISKFGFVEPSVAAHAAA